MASMGKTQVEITLSDEARDVLERFIAAAEKVREPVPGEVVELEAVAEDAMAERVAKQVISAMNDAFLESRGIRL